MWFKHSSTGNTYKFRLSSVSMNGHMLAGSSDWTTAFVDSGTTFTYVPPNMWNSLMIHFDFFCDMTLNI
jgi:hypothetical protein